MSSDSGDYSSSSEEEETVLHKPVLLAKKTKDSGSNDIPNKEELERQSMKRSIEAANKLAAETEELRRQTELNYTATDKDLLRRTMALDDDDSIDAPLECRQWQKRQEARKLRQRELMVKRQQEQEQDEVSRIRNHEKNV